MNKKIREFYEDLVLCINKFDVPAEVKRIILKDLYYQAERLCNQIAAEDTKQEKGKEKIDHGYME